MKPNPYRTVILAIAIALLLAGGIAAFVAAASPSYSSAATGGPAIAIALLSAGGTVGLAWLIVAALTYTAPERASSPDTATSGVQGDWVDRDGA